MRNDLADAALYLSSGVPNTIRETLLLSANVRLVRPSRTWSNEPAGVTALGALVVSAGLAGEHSCLAHGMESPSRSMHKDADHPLCPQSLRARIGGGFAGRLRTAAAQPSRIELPSLTQMPKRTIAPPDLNFPDRSARSDRAIGGVLHYVFPDEILTGIPAIGLVFAVAILAQVGDVSRFKAGAQFVGYCSLQTSLWDSSWTKGRHRRTHKSNRLLKMTLVVAGAAARQCSSTIAIYSEHLRQQPQVTV